MFADDPTGKAERGEIVYGTYVYCLNGHTGQKVEVMGPVEDSLRFRPAALASETVQKKS